MQPGAAARPTKGKSAPAGSALKLPAGVRKIAKPARATDIALELTNTSLEAKKKNLISLGKTLGPSVPILSSSVTVSATTQSGWIAHPERLTGLGALPSLLEGLVIELAPTRKTSPQVLTTVNEFAGTLGKETAIVQDTVGLVMPRIICMLANEACYAIMEEVATGRDIDTAMKLGTNYPRGPVEWAERIGMRQVLAVITALHKSFRDDRYRAAPLLLQSAGSNTLLSQT